MRVSPLDTILLLADIELFIFHGKSPTRENLDATPAGSVEAAQNSYQDWIKQTIVFIANSLYCFVSIVSRSIASIQLG